MKPGLLVLGKAPVPGLTKTRIAEYVGDVAAADLAAAALLDTIDVAEQWAPCGRRLMALTGDLVNARRGDEIASRLRNWTVIGQRGSTFAERLTNAHSDAEMAWGATTTLVQIGTDTPHLTQSDLDLVLAALQVRGGRTVDAVLGPAEDGGWWALATRRGGYAGGLVDVAMSTSYTCAHTDRMLRRAGARVSRVHCLSDVDTLDDALYVASQAPGTRFASAVDALLSGVAR